MEVSQHCEDCDIEESTSMHEKCESCGHLVGENDTCPCIITKLQGESAERIRALISMGHPNEEGEPYGRFDVMDECRRRGTQLFLDLGWPIGPDAIYKNKYTGDEFTLREDLFKFCMECEKTESFDVRLARCGWSILEHSWPKALWTDNEMFDEYKSKLSYFKDKEDKMVDWGIEEVGVYDDDEDTDDTDVRTLVKNSCKEYHTEDDKVVRGKRKEVDKAQAKLDGW